MTRHLGAPSSTTLSPGSEALLQPGCDPQGSPDVLLGARMGISPSATGQVPGAVGHRAAQPRLPPLTAQGRGPLGSWRRGEGHLGTPRSPGASLGEEVSCPLSACTPMAQVQAGTCLPPSLGRRRSPGRDAALPAEGQGARSTIICFLFARGRLLRAEGSGKNGVSFERAPAATGGRRHRAAAVVAGGCKGYCSPRANPALLHPV